MPDGKVRFCGKEEVARRIENVRFPPETFRLVRPNITKHLTARIRSEAEAHKIVLNFRNVLNDDIAPIASDQPHQVAYLSLSCCYDTRPDETKILRTTPYSAISPVYRAYCQHSCPGITYIAVDSLSCCTVSRARYRRHQATRSSFLL